MLRSIVKHILTSVRWALAILANATLIANVSSQDAPNASPAGGQQPSPSSEPRTAPDAEVLNYIYNKTPEDGAAADVARDQAVESKTEVAGKKGALESLAGAESMLSPEFEQFLSMEEAPAGEMREYLDAVKTLRGQLRERNPADAFDRLLVLSDYSWDAGLSKQIAARVQAVWDTNETSKGILHENGTLEQDVRRSNWNVDVEAQNIRRQTQDGSKKMKAGELPSPQAAGQASAALAGTMRITEQYFRAVDAKARIKLNEVQISNLETKAKSDLAEYVATLLSAKRYLHAIIAAEFYQALFRDGELPPELAKASTAALEIRHKIANAVNVFEFKADKGDLLSGSKILKTAFDMGDTTPEMLGLDRERKGKVVDFYNTLRKMRNLIESRNFGDLEKTLTKLEDEVKDFDTTKPRQLIESVKLEAQIRLGNARIAAQEGDRSKALAEFKAAAQIWPSNPAIKEAAAEFYAKQDSGNRSVEEFDRLFQRQDYRQIAEKQLSFAVATANDPARQERLKKALQTVQNGEAAIEKAKIYAANGDDFGAWEQIELASQDWPDDNALNRLRADYAKKVPEFVSTLDRAQEAESNKDFGYSLNCFLLAQQYYRNSQVANAAIKRLGEKILASEPEKNMPTEEPTATPAIQKG